MSLHTSAESSRALDKKIPQAEPSCVCSDPGDLRDLRGSCGVKGKRGVFQFQPG